MKLQQIKDTGIDYVSKNKKGNFIARFPFFYTHGKTTQDSINYVKQKLPTANIVDSGEKWAAFRGGASIANQSHWYVEFNFENNKTLKT